MNAYEAGNNYAYGYNTAGQLSTVTAPGNRQWNFSYDASGKLVDYTWPNGQKTEYDYDDDGVLKELLHKSGSVIKSGWTYEHDKSGAIRQIRDARPGNDEGWDYRYDHRGRLVQALRQNVSGDPAIRMNYSWDRADNMLSQTRYNLTSRMKDTFSDGNYTTNPVWTVESGIWDASFGALATSTATGLKSIYTANSYADADFWYSFKRTAKGGLLDNALVQLRYVNEDNWLGIRFMWGMLVLVEKVAGTENTLATSNPVFSDQDQWYDLYVQLDGSQMTLYSAERGGEQKKILSAQTTLPATTNRLRVRVNGTMSFEFDDFRICSRTVHATHSMACTYGKANQLESVTTGGMTSFFTYDPWGRLATRTATVGGQQYTATYTWRFGDKLQRIDSSFPGEAPVVLYNYDGLGKRRIKAVGDETHYWRWDAGYNVLAEYKDQTPDWDVGALQRFFVPFGHTALAETTPGAGGSVTNGTYTYLAHDHLGSSRKGYNQSQTEIHSNEHLPFGQRFSTTGTVPYHEWTGKPWDADTQMYYFPYRYYSPMMNRWTATDPLGLVDGPNLYGYVGGNPIVYVDPEGGMIIAMSCTVIGLVLGAIGTHTLGGAALWGTAGLLIGTGVNYIYSVNNFSKDVEKGVNQGLEVIQPYVDELNKKCDALDGTDGYKCQIPTKTFL